MNSKLLNQLYVINLVLNIVGFYVINIAGTFLNVDNSNIINAPFRYGFLLFSLVLITLNILFVRKRKEIIRPFLLINIFWVLYLIRISVDILLFDIKLPLDNPFINYFGFAFGVCFLPSLNTQFINIKSIDKFYKYLFPTFLFLAVISIPIALTSLQEFSRASGGVGFQTLSYGYFGSAVTIISLFRLLNTKSTITKHLINIIGIIIGTIIMGLSASKGPFFGLFLILIIYFFSKLSFRKFLVFGSIIIIGIVYSSYYFSFTTTIGSSLEKRLNKFAEEGDQNRLLLYENAINEAIDNPIFGNHFVIEDGFGTGVYPHNFIIEAFMAMGIFGGILFLVIVAKSFIITYKVLNNYQEYSWIPLLYLVYLFRGMFSGALYNSGFFWVLLVLLFFLNRIMKEKKLENNIRTI